MTFLFGILGGAALYGAFILSRCFFQVEQGQLAVLTSFGRAVHREEDSQRLRTYGPGLHRKRPWEKVIHVPMMEQNLDLSGEEGGRTAMAADGTLLRLDSILRYVPVERELSHFLFGLRSPIEHITGLFTCLLRNEIANFREAPDKAPSGAEEPGSYALIRRERRMLNARIEEFCRTRIGRRYGVGFNAVDLTDVLPPDELADALNAVIQARSEADATHARAEAETQQRVLAAERGLAIARAHSKAVETEIGTLGRYLSELAQKNTLHHYVARRRSEVTSDARTIYRKDSR
ncbi:SPFH domain-containing protein [Corallococcus sp. M34]|uniref:SPFH domain-containing protein n=1 Tax=Citreicoccus inhibens TaxID=2849499 RepID=UPI0013152916|nr:SPFH domain-containing protein [Citreicoccus inhibens]MBU8899129.1 SPFH domain-containing protein [Citreicoccus inhibens]